MTTHRHFIIHKPFGFLSQFKLVDNRKKKLLGELGDFPEGIMAIGRLDKDSEGLLLLTTDGKVSYEICSSKVDKEYYVQLDGNISDEALLQMETGVEIGFEGIKYMTKPCLAQRLAAPPDFPPRTKKIRDDRHGPTRWVSITIREGKYRQVRKMTAAVGFPTLRLFRVRIGNIELGSMKAGAVREVEVLEYL
ncbi:MAG: 23S rRNA pseudouridine2457 synthase [Saprospiraceae bacterium]|jgi:23S rRNA pseudouridine2457 synthase